MIKMNEEINYMNNQFLDYWFTISPPTDKCSRYFIATKFKVLDWLLPSGDGWRNSLDIGCSDGLIVELMDAKGYNGYGVDIIDNQYTIADARNLPFSDGQFDVITILDTLEHIDGSKNVALDEAWRVLRPGGLLLVTVPNSFSYFYKRSWLTFLLRGLNLWNTRHYNRNYWDWKRMLSRHFEVERVIPLITMPFKEPKLSSIENIHLPKSDRFAFMSACPMFVCRKSRRGK